MTTRKYVGRAWSPARTLSVLDLKGRFVEMLSHAERRGLSDHMELLAKLLARLLTATRRSWSGRKRSSTLTALLRTPRR